MHGWKEICYMKLKVCMSFIIWNMILDKPHNTNIPAYFPFPFCWLLVSFFSDDTAGKCFLVGRGRGEGSGPSSESCSNCSYYKFLKAEKGTADTWLYHQMDCFQMHFFVCVKVTRLIFISRSRLLSVFSNQHWGLWKECETESWSAELFLRKSRF